MLARPSEGYTLSHTLFVTTRPFSPSLHPVLLLDLFAGAILLTACSVRHGEPDESQVRARGLLEAPLLRLGVVGQDGVLRAARDGGNDQSGESQVRLRGMLQTEALRR